MFAVIPKPSMPSIFIRRVEFAEFPACSGQSEGPMDSCLSRLPLPLPLGNFGSQLARTIQSTVQALTVHDPDLGLGPIQPTAVLGRVMPLDLVQQATGVFRRERFVQARPVM